MEVPLVPCPWHSVCWREPPPRQQSRPTAHAGAGERRRERRDTAQAQAGHKHPSRNAIPMVTARSLSEQGCSLDLCGHTEGRWTGRRHAGVTRGPAGVGFHNGHGPAPSTPGTAATPNPWGGTTLRGASTRARVGVLTTEILTAGGDSA